MICTLSEKSQVKVMDILDKDFYLMKQKVMIFLDLGIHVHVSFQKKHEAGDRSLKVFHA